jgi:hypothetical protein
VSIGEMQFRVLPLHFRALFHKLQIYFVAQRLHVDDVVWISAQSYIYLVWKVEWTFSTVSTARFRMLSPSSGQTSQTDRLRMLLIGRGRRSNCCWMVGYTPLLIFSTRRIGIEIRHGINQDCVRSEGILPSLKRSISLHRAVSVRDEVSDHCSCYIR